MNVGIAEKALYPENAYVTQEAAKQVDRVAIRWKMESYDALMALMIRHEDSMRGRCGRPQPDAMVSVYATEIMAVTIMDVVNRDSGIHDRFVLIPDQYQSFLSHFRSEAAERGQSVIEENYDDGE